MSAVSRLRRIAAPLMIILLLLGGIHYFIYRTALRSTEDCSLILALVMMVGFALIPTALIVNMSELRKRLVAVTVTGYCWLGFFFIAFFLSLIEFAVSIFWKHPYSYWTLLAALSISIWSLWKTSRPAAVVTHELQGPKFMQGFRLVQISDLHVGMPRLDRAWLEIIVAKINDTNPDIIAITGDLADGEFLETSPMLEPLRSLRAKKLYTTGNHEYIRGGDWEARLKELGFDVLHNSNVKIDRQGESLLIAGVPDRMANRFHRHLESDPDLALRTSMPVGYKILLAHEPASVFDIKNERCDLLLSGHTHGGQIFPFALLVRLQQPVAAGFKKIRDVLVFAHQGTGYWGPPMRWFTRCEIVVFKWT